MARSTRIGDAERDAAIEALQEHHGAGRLSLEEFDERMTRAMGAKVESDLRALFEDLPGGAAFLRPGVRTSGQLAAVRQSAPPANRGVLTGIQAAIWPVAIMIAFFTPIHFWAAIVFAIIASTAISSYRKGSGGQR